FEPSDLRSTEWVRSKIVSGTEYFYPYKYRVRNTALGESHMEYFVVLRLAEQYLIRAEARVHLGRLTGANSAEMDINSIRNRAGLPNTTAETAEDLMGAIEQERRSELFTEGHRWFDLIRTQRTSDILSP